MKTPFRAPALGVKRRATWHSSRVVAPWLLATVALLTVAASARAHDTWFAPLPAQAGAAPSLALGTGDRFPKQEFAVAAEFLARQGCRSTHRPGTRALKVLRQTDTALVLRPTPGADTCWAQLKPFDIELPPDKVAIYLDEIRAPVAVRAHWAGLQARGVPWKERYVKHARIALTGAAAQQYSAAGPDMDVDVQLDTRQGLPRVGQPLHFQVLSAGLPLAGLPVELRTEHSPLGLWRQTDAEGRVSLPAPLPGRWVLRGTELRPSSASPDRWESRFVTLAFEVLPRSVEN